MAQDGSNRPSDGVILAPGVIAESLDQVVSPPPDPGVWRLFVNGVSFTVPTDKIMQPRAMPRDIGRALGVEIKPFTRPKWTKVIQTLLANAESISSRDKRNS